MKESRIFHCPRCMVLKLPRTSWVMVGMVASKCMGCHHCHDLSSKMMRTLDTNQRTKLQTCLWTFNLRPETCRDWFSTIAANVVWTKFFLTSSYQMQSAPSPKECVGKANKYEFNWTTLQKQAKGTNDTNQRIWRLKFSSLSHVDVNEVRTSHKQTNLLENWPSAKQWAGERGDPGFPQEFLSKSKSRIWMSSVPKDVQYVSNDPLGPQFATCQLRTKCFDSRNVGTNLDLWMQQLTIRDQWPATCFVDQGPKWQEMESLIWPPCILWTN